MIVLITYYRFDIEVYNRLVIFSPTPYYYPETRSILDTH